MAVAFGDKGNWRNLALVALCLIMAVVFLAAHAVYPGLPSVQETGGWRDWNDQGLYLRASQAWAEGDLRAASHWYPPGYPLMASALLRITPHDRFLLPDLASLLICQLVCARLAIRLFPALRWAAALGAACFLVASLGTLPGLKSWLIPWTTTPAAAAILLTLLAVLRLAEQPGPGRALAAGAALGAIVLFRPGDVMPVALAACVVMLPVLWRLKLRRALVVSCCAAVAASCLVGLALALTAATTGFGPETYYGQSAATGFEWRLLPLRFVTLVLDPRPLFDGVGTERVEPGIRRGLAEVFVWMLPGLAGAVALCASRARLRVHVLLGLWAAGHLALLLCYRDLHIMGFWTYGNIHYFKVVQTVLLLLAVSAAIAMVDGRFRLRETGVALVVLVGLSCWRAELVVGDAVGPAGSVGDLSALDHAAIVPGGGTWAALYSGAHTLAIGGEIFHHNDDFKLYPRTGDFLVVPLRLLPPGDAVLELDSGAVQTGPARAARQVLVFGVPCLFGLAGANICGRLGAPLIE
jgi:hypothetical protein